MWTANLDILPLMVIFAVTYSGHRKMIRQLRNKDEGNLAITSF
jgi:hypothetical protein